MVSEKPDPFTEGLFAAFGMNAHTIESLGRQRLQQRRGVQAKGLEDRLCLEGIGVFVTQMLRPKILVERRQRRLVFSDNLPQPHTHDYFGIGHVPDNLIDIPLSRLGNVGRLFGGNAVQSLGQNDGAAAKSVKFLLHNQ